MMIKRLPILLRILFVFTGFFIGLFLYGLAKSSFLPLENPPDWNDPSIILALRKNKDNFLVHYKLHGREGDYYVGNSKIYLDTFMGKQVKITGDFPLAAADNQSNEQCIHEMPCHLIFTPRFWEGKNVITSVINIDSIQ